MPYSWTQFDSSSFKCQGLGIGKEINTRAFIQEGDMVRFNFKDSMSSAIHILCQVMHFSTSIHSNSAVTNPNDCSIREY